MLFYRRMLQYGILERVAFVIHQACIFATNSKKNVHHSCIRINRSPPIFRVKFQFRMVSSFSFFTFIVPPQEAYPAALPKRQRPLSYFYPAATTDENHYQHFRFHFSEEEQRPKSRLQCHDQTHQPERPPCQEEARSLPFGVRGNECRWRRR